MPDKTSAYCCQLLPLAIVDDGNLSINRNVCMAKVGLTPGQQRFIAEYLIDRNASKAAIRAGYTVRSSRTMGSRMLADPNVRAAIDAGAAKHAARAGITVDRVLTEAELLSFSDVTHYHVGDDGRIELAEGAPEGATRAIAGLKVRKRTTVQEDGSTVTTSEVDIKLHDKVTPLKLVGRHVGLFPNHVDDPKVAAMAERRLKQLIADAEARARQDALSEAMGVVEGATKSTEGESNE